MQKTRDAISKYAYGSFLAFLAIGLTVFIQCLFGSLTFKFENDSSSLISILKSAGISLATAFFEEYIFRVLLLSLLLRILNKHHFLIIIAGSLIFAAVHAANPHFTAIAFVSHFLGGVVYSYAYLKTKTIWLPFGLHFGWNFTQAILGMPVSGSASHSFLSISFASDAFYNGGLYGFEGGILSIASRLALLLALAYMLRKNLHALPAPKQENTELSIR